MLLPLRHQQLKEQGRQPQLQPLHHGVSPCMCSSGELRVTYGQDQPNQSQKLDAGVSATEHTCLKKTFRGCNASLQSYVSQAVQTSRMKGAVPVSCLESLVRLWPPSQTKQTIRQQVINAQVCDSHMCSCASAFGLSVHNPCAVPSFHDGCSASATGCNQS